MGSRAKKQTRMKVSLLKAILYVFAFGVLALGGYSFVLAATDCSDLEGSAKDQCDSLEAQAKIYRNIIEQKNAQGETLNGQLSSLDAQAQVLNLEIQKSQNKISSLDSDVQTLSQRIEEKNKIIDQQKRVLSEMLRSYYQDYSNDVIPAILTEDESLNFFQAAQASTDANARLSDLLHSVQDLRDGLQKEQDDLNAKKADAEQTQSDLSDQNDQLDNAKTNKQTLLAQTQSDEAKYQELLSNVKAEKDQLFDFSSASNLGEVSASVKDYDQPDKKDWSSLTYFSQKDSRWGNKKINGVSGSLMRDYGCAVTALAMALRANGASTDPGKLLKDADFSRDLIVWPGSWSSGIKLASSTGHGNVSWSTIDKEIKNDHPVIVHIRKSNGQGHYVLITGKDKKDYIVHDPYFGPNLYLSTSRALIGKLGTNTGTSIDQMIVYE